jgi:hypothetical protein
VFDNLPFGLVTRRYLEQRLTELTAEYQASKDFQEELRFEWDQWYRKFRNLFASWVRETKKADKRAAQDDAGDTIDSGEAPDIPPATAEEQADAQGLLKHAGGFRTRRQF